MESFFSVFQSLPENFSLLKYTAMKKYIFWDALQNLARTSFDKEATHSATGVRLADIAGS